MEGFGKFIGAFYAIGIFIGALGIGNMFQSNQAYVQLNHVSGGALDGLGWLVGLIMAVVVFSVIVGGIKSIAKVTEKIVLFMAMFYCLFAVIVILMNYASLPAAIGNIFTGAFTADGVAGGALGAMIIGFQRAVFSNEASFHATFQSRFGSEPWLQPYTDESVVGLAEKGIKHVMVMAPGFVADCLETLDELDIELHEEFIEHGGEKFSYIPCLNDSKAGMRVIEEIAVENLAGWVDMTA